MVKHPNSRQERLAIKKLDGQKKKNSKERLKKEWHEAESNRDWSRRQREELKAQEAKDELHRFFKGNISNDVLV